MNWRLRIEVRYEVISCPVDLGIHKRPDCKSEHQNAEVENQPPHAQRLPLISTSAQRQHGLVDKRSLDP